KSKRPGTTSESRKHNSTSSDPYSILGFGAALALIESVEEIARFTAGAITLAFRVQLGAVVLENATGGEMSVSGQFRNAPLGEALAKEIKNFVSSIVTNSSALSDEVGREINVREEHLPEATAAGLCRLLLVRLRTIEHNFGVVIAGKSSEEPYLPIHAASLEALASQVSMALHRIQLNNEHAAIAAALRESEARTRAIVDTAVDGIITIDQHGTIESFNPAAVQIFGYAPDEILGQNVKILMPEPYHSEHDSYIAHYLSTGKKRIIGIGRETVGRRKDGTTFPIYLAVSEMRLGERRLFTGILTDITERKRAEEALRKSEATHRALLNALPDLVFRISKDGTYLDFKAAKEFETYVPPAEFLGRKVCEVMPPEIAEQTMHYLERTLLTGDVQIFEYQLPMQDDIRYYEARIVNCGMDEVLAIVRDVTERRLAEQALRESEERLSRILESAMDAIITIDEQKRIRLFNKAAEKIFHCEAAEAVGSSIDRFLSDNFRNLLTNHMRNLGKGKISKRYMWTPEGLTAIRANGEEFPIEATVSQVEVSGNKLYTIILRDINDRKQTEEELNKLHLEKVYLQQEIISEYNFEEIIGASTAMRKVFQNIEKVAATDSTVLLTGETGTGKELIARAIHNLSSRKERVLVKVNCAALPPGLVESELLGHEKGAFTGATARKKGRFELADGGTIFLDEVGQLPLETQSKLLRVLQEQEFERVGGTQTQKVNVRVIAATNRNLEEAVKLNAFRADLYYRLNIFPIHIPPLRERRDDIPMLSNYFIKKFSRRMGKRTHRISPRALEKLLSYDWPGNVRELANILEGAVILCDEGVIKEEHIGI
ncbi:MAG: sigma 54-interacting transcriptional regulator, partial [bacterium]